MRIQLDTNVLLRGAEPGDPFHRDAQTAVAGLIGHGFDPCLVPQNLYEFWVVSTRPVPANGRGKTAPEVTAEIADLKAQFVFLADTPAVCDDWERLVAAHTVLGKPAHDARFVAAMHVHGLTHLLTFNDTDFRRYPVITVLTPALALSLYPPPPMP